MYPTTNTFNLLVKKKAENTRKEKLQLASEYNRGHLTSVIERMKGWGAFLKILLQCVSAHIKRFIPLKGRKKILFPPFA